MKAHEFCYWLQGYFELGGNSLTREQLTMIAKHAQIVQHGPFSPYLMFVNDLRLFLRTHLAKMKPGSLLDRRKVALLKNRIELLFNPVTRTNLQESFQPHKPFSAPYKPKPSEPLQSQFREPLGGYEPLGDIYNSQRLC